MSYKEIVLAAWLHDIGKFAQRAGMKCSSTQEGGSYSHQHYTEQFLQSVKDCLPDDIDAGEVIRLASRHHNPSEYDEWIIAHGDRLSNGAENENHDDETPEKLYQTRLVHLVSTLQINDENIKEKPRPFYTPLRAMEEDAIFASDTVKVDKQDYKTLWEAFEKDFRAIKGKAKGSHEFIRSLDTLMERYCWCIPSSTIQDTDISLYQHSKLVAAFAGTLYLYHREKDTQTESALKEKDENKFLFIQGDMSGIQKYIFDIKIPDSSAKLLRARSFQVWALSEVIAEYIAGQFGVSAENILTTSGGKFLLLAPNTCLKPDTRSVEEKLDGLRFDIEEFFLREFAGKITCVISGGVQASSSDLQKGKTQDLLNEIGYQGDMAKQKKMQAVLRAGDEPVKNYVLETMYADLKKHRECKYCGTLPADPDLKEDKDICKNCHELIKIGGKLLKAKKIILNTDKLSNFHDMVKVKEKNDERFGYLTEYEPGYPLMSLPYVAPFDNKKNELCSFGDIAKNAKGDKKLAMFKSDVDNLGLIFSSSWGEGQDNRISFSRYAQLSRHLHYFFSAFIANFISNNKEHPEYEKNIYTVFSGGDDLCVIGAWDTIMRFAADFRENFSKFTNNNPSVTLSGGIAMFDPHLPVRVAADMAEDTLHEAKGRKEKNKNATNKDENNAEEKTENIVKNGISVFGVTVCWDEYDKCLEDGKTIDGYIKNEKVSSAVVYKMIDFANRAGNVRKGNFKERDMLWRSNFRYIITRNIKPENEDVLKFFQNFGAGPDSDSLMENSRIAVCYALYANREHKEE
jgi:CRISPR-associated protein Csm1